MVEKMPLTIDLKKKVFMMWRISITYNELLQIEKKGTYKALDN